MKLYKTTFLTDVIGSDGLRKSSTQWHGSASDASKARTAAKALGAFSKPTTEDVEVPVVKAGLLAFLNQLTN